MKKFSLLLAVLLALTLVFGVSCDGSTSEPPAGSGPEFNIDPSLYAKYTGSALGKSLILQLSENGISITDESGKDQLEYLLGAPLSEVRIADQKTGQNFYTVAFIVYEKATSLSATLYGNNLRVSIVSEVVGNQTYNFTKQS